MRCLARLLPISWDPKVVRSAALEREGRDGNEATHLTLSTIVNGAPSACDMESLRFLVLVRNAPWI